MSDRFDIDDLRKTFRILRLERQETQAAVASKLGITQAAVSAFELGKNIAPRGNTMRRVASLVDEWRTDDTDSNVLTFPPQPRVGRPHTDPKFDDLEQSPMMEVIRESLIKYMGESSAPLVRRMSDKELMYAHLLQRHTECETR